MFGQMTEKKLTAVILGLNEPGLLLLEAASRVEHFHVAAVADKDAALARRTAEQYKCTAYDDYRQLVIQSQFDCLLVAAPLHSCDEHVKAATRLQDQGASAGAQAVGKGGQPFAGDGLIKSMDDFRSKFSLPDPGDDDLYGPIEQFIEGKEEFPVICSMRLGFLSALVSIGFQTYMEAIYLDPELIDAVTGAYVDWSAKAIRRLCDMGVDAIKTTDDFAFNTGPFMSPASFRQWVIPYHERAYREISVPWILHTDGEITGILQDLFTMGINGIHPIDPNCMDIRAFKRDYGDKVCILGNVNINTLSMGTPEETYAEARDLIRDLAPGYGYIVSSGNSVPNYAKPENVLALVRAIEEFGKY